MAEYRELNGRVGRWTHGNAYAYPPGTVVTGSNFECSRDNVYRKIRGREAYGSGLPAQNVLQLMQYNQRLIAHMANNTLYRDDGAGAFTQISGAFAQPESDYLMQSLEFAGNLYFTTSLGIYKLDSNTAAASTAGVPQALGFDVELSGASGWLADSSNVSYRVLWKITDANNNDVVGAPSERTDVTNASGGTRNVSLRVYIPAGITTAHTLQVYRSSVVASTVTPPEDFQLVYEANPAAGDITAKAITLTDILADDFRGADLYTNTTQEGIEQANTIPPVARSITKYKGFVFYGNVDSIERLYTSLVGVTGLTAATSTVTVSDGTNTLTLGCVADVADATIASVADSGGLVQVTTTGAHGYTSGDYVRFIGVTGTGGLPEAVEGLVYEVTVTAGTTFKISLAWNAAYTATGGRLDFYEDVGSTPRFVIHSGGTASENVDATARSIVRTINQAIGNTFLYAYYVSGIADVPGQILVTSRTPGATAFYATANSSATGGSFSPAIPTSGTTYVSTDDEFQNAIMWSKEGQGEAVPLVNILKVGSSGDPILRVVGLRDSLFIIKRRDGIYRLTGEQPSNFNVDEFDGTVECSQINSIAVGQNSIFMNSTIGYVRISDVGVEVVGRDNEFKDLQPRLNANFFTTGYGWFYEEDKTYFNSTMRTTTSTTQDVTNTYNSFTRAWMTNDHGVYTGDTNIKVGLVVDGRLYTAPLTGSALLRERKSFLDSDFSTPSLTNTIAAIDTATDTITLGTAVTIPANSIIQQGNTGRDVVTVNTTTSLTLASVNNLATNVSLNVSGAVASPTGRIRITTSADHGLMTGNGVLVASVGGTVEANGTWTIEKVDADEFDLVNSTFANAYTAGGTVTNQITIIPGVVSMLQFQGIHCGYPEYDKQFQKLSLFFDNDETDVGQLLVETWTDFDETPITTPLFSENLDGWGVYPWGEIWGALSEKRHMLTLIPEEHSRGTLLYVRVTHSRPNEQIAICGFSVVFEIVDTRYQK